RSVSSSSGHIRASTRPKKPTICAGLKDVATTVVSKPLAAATSRQTSVWVGIGDVSIADLLEASVYQYLLVYYEGAKGEQPKAANVPLVLLRYDTSPGAQTKSDTQISHARVELSILPLRLTLDQDTLNWLDVFAENVNMHVYAAVDLKLMGDFEKEEVPEARGELVEARQAELEHLGSSALRTPKIPPSIWLDSFKISEVVACIDYRCKRVNLKRLRRGDRAELINLLPILEGLEVKLRSAHLRGLRNVTELSGQLIESWKGDMSKAQMLRSVCRMTPIRSLTNISCSLTELLSLPFLQYRYTSPIDSVARDPRTGRRLGWWRQLSEFATCLTIESLTALERAVSTTQSVLETASDLVDATAPSSLVSSSSADWTAVECVDDRDSDSASQRHLTSGSMADDDDDEWLSVGRGAVRDRHFAPSSGVEQLQFITQRLSRDIQNTGRDALIAPLQDYAHGRASTESVVVSVARGVPLCILRPAAGATEAVSVALRTATSSLDKGQAEKERERKFKGPGIV
ncbi:Autophagy- protein 2 A, partial [Perkinsus chesapeaki]